MIWAGGKKVSKGMSSEGHELRRRSIVKALTWRVLTTILAFAVVYAFTREILVSVAVTLTSNGLSTLLYFWHERVWSGIRWGVRGDCH